MSGHVKYEVTRAHPLVSSMNTILADQATGQWTAKYTRRGSIRSQSGVLILDILDSSRDILDSFGDILDSTRDILDSSRDILILDSSKDILDSSRDILDSFGHFLDSSRQKKSLGWWHRRLLGGWWAVGF